MPTKRWHNLEPGKQRPFLVAAAAEFAEHGFGAASINRIVERAGSSKGSLYYYFEDKTDLYATVVRDTVVRFIAYCGTPAPVTDAEEYWTEVDRLCRVGLGYYHVDPYVAGLLRSIARDGMSAVPVQDTRKLVSSWLSGLIALGQSVGAVRDDLPMSLMVAVATSISEGIDLWLAEHLDSFSSEDLVPLMDRLVDMYRRLATPYAEQT